MAAHDKRPTAFARFEALAKRGQPLQPFKAPASPEGRKVTQDYQRAELERSIAHLRTQIGLGGQA